MIQHGLLVWEYTRRIIVDDMEGIIKPKWLENFNDEIRNNLLNYRVIKRAVILHDIGKPHVKIVDEDGVHYPNHAKKSNELFRQYFPKHEIEAQLIEYDMLFHSGTVEQILSSNLDTSTLVTLMIIALASIHANAQSSSGIESTSFKIKFKKLEKLGKKICDKLFNHPYMYILIRNDLSNAQRAVQACHAAIESSRAFMNKESEHPSVILCTVKSEHKLLKCAEELDLKDIDYKIFREPDIGNQATALASKPLIGKERQAFSRFQLLT